MGIRLHTIKIVAGAVMPGHFLNARASQPLFFWSSVFAAVCGMAFRERGNEEQNSVCPHCRVFLSPHGDEMQLVCAIPLVEKDTVYPSPHGDEMQLGSEGCTKRRA